MINNIQIALIFLIISFIILILVSSLGVEGAFYLQSNSLKKFDHIQLYQNIGMLYKIIDKNKPYIVYLNPVIDYDRFDHISKKYNVIQLYNKNNYIKNYMKKKILKAFDIIVSNIDIKNIHIYGLCSYTDVACYIAHKRPDVVKSLILDIPIYKFKNTLSNLPIFDWIKHFQKDYIDIHKKFIIQCKILILFYEKESLCELKYSLLKAKDIYNNNNNNNIYLYNMKYPLYDHKNIFFNHAKTYLHDDYYTILGKWIK
jgi:hypothetical protein